MGTLCDDGLGPPCLIPEKGAGVKAVASQGAASRGGPLRRNARLLVAWRTS